MTTKAALFSRLACVSATIFNATAFMKMESWHLLCSVAVSKRGSRSSFFVGDIMKYMQRSKLRLAVEGTCKYVVSTSIVVQSLQWRGVANRYLRVEERVFLKPGKKR
jgi:hypothetical protein